MLAVVLFRLQPSVDEARWGQRLSMISILSTKHTFASRLLPRTLRQGSPQRHRRPMSGGASRSVNVLPSTQSVP